MATFWVEFEDGRAPGCIETDPYRERGETRGVLEIAAEFGKVKAVHSLPYPRNPRLGVKSDCPSFCYARNVSECFDKGSCPQAYSCTE